MQIIFEGRKIMKKYYLEATEIIADGNYDVAVNLMDDEIREAIHFDNPEMDGLEFLTEYLKRHEQKFGEEFTI